MKVSKLRGVLLVLGSVVLFALMGLLVISVDSKEEHTTVVGFIMTGSIGEGGWNGVNYEGMKAACDKLGAKLIVKENVAEFSGGCEEAIHELAADGAGMIVLSSYGYLEEAKEIVKEYPDVAFYANSSEYHDENLTSYFVRMYQARYLSGIIAGNQSQTGEIGYVAAMSNNEVNRGISAFTLGVRRANPDAVVNVIWTGSWDDEEKEVEAAKTLIEEVGVDVITYHQNQIHVLEEAEKAGVDSIGYLMVSDEALEYCLTTILCNWEILYEELLREFLKGEGNAVDNFWLGISEGVVDLAPYSERVSEESIALVETAKAELLASPGVFVGEIYDTEGNKRCDLNEIISDEMLLEHFDWFVEGVEIYEE